MKATSLIPDDYEYQLLVATCYIRLGNYDQAMSLCEDILNSSPYNEKAKYLHAFCLLSRGDSSAALVELTNIIEVAQVYNNEQVNDDDETHEVIEKRMFTVPPERIFETRGILYRSMDQHELSITDLQKAVDLNGSVARNCFLIGLSQSLLGEYESAIKYFNTAQEKGYGDMFTLITTRGIVLRLLGKSSDALLDFMNAYKFINYDNQVRCAMRRIFSGQIFRRTASILYTCYYFVMFQKLFDL